MADEIDVDEEVRSLYAGEPSAFVASRAALAKRLRDAGRRDDADAVKALRKPERRAWALDRAAAEHPDELTRLTSAAADVATVNERGADLRAASSALRDAVRAVAATTADPATATADLMAVIADPDALDRLVAGRLVEVPEGGGFGPLPIGGVPAPAPAPARPRGRKRGAPTAEEAEEARRAEEEARAAEEAAARRRELVRALAQAEKVRERVAAAHEKAIRRREEAEEAERSVADELAGAEAAVDSARAALDELR